MLTVVMYHYVRNGVAGPRLKGLTPEAFVAQVEALATTHEMATVESAVAYVQGRYAPARDLCLLTFDDGVVDHYRVVLPVLAERRIQGVFFLATACQDGRVATVHQNHMLLGTLGFAQYRAACLDRIASLAPGLSFDVDRAAARRTYRWDDEETAAFKYLLNFALPPELCAGALQALFLEHIGDEAAVAREFYLSWSQARAMQAAGMAMGGHSHRHVVLARLDEDQQADDIATCAQLLRSMLAPQSVWPFSYPYGGPHSFTAATSGIVERWFGCAFSTTRGANDAGAPLFALRRLDPKDLAIAAA